MARTRKLRRLKQRLWGKGLDYVADKKEGLYLSPVEQRMIEILDGKILKLDRFKNAEGRPMTIVYKQPRLLKREHFKRTGDKLILFSNDLKMALAIKGREFNRDVIGAWERDQKLAEDGWRIQYIPIEWLRDSPLQVRSTITQFIYA